MKQSKSSKKNLEYKKQVDGFSGAEYKSFEKITDA
ncbi:viroplasmin family protein, partial [Lactobacillus paragasseri]